MKKIEYRNETSDDSSCSRKYLEIEVDDGDLEKVKYFIRILYRHLYVPIISPKTHHVFFCGKDLPI